MGVHIMHCTTLQHALQRTLQHFAVDVHAGLFCRHVWLLNGCVVLFCAYIATDAALSVSWYTFVGLFCGYVRLFCIYIANSFVYI